MFKIVDGREHFYQWDLNRQIQVEDATITELHFCNKTDDCSLVVEVVDGVANVPNILLQTTWDIRVYGYTGDYTKIEKRYKVVARTKPSDYVYTETEIKNYDDLERKIDKIGGTASTLSSGLSIALANANTAQATADAASQKADTAKNLANNAGEMAYNHKQEVENVIKPRIAELEKSVGDIENALNEIAALQATYIGGAE